MLAHRRRPNLSVVELSFGEFLRSERERLGMTQLELARKVRVSSANIVAGWESGMSAPQAGNLAELGKLFQWDFNVVMSYFGAPELEGADRLVTEIQRRPLLLRLLQAGRNLSDNDLMMVTTMVQPLAAGRRRGESESAVTGN